MSNIFFYLALKQKLYIMKLKRIIIIIDSENSEPYSELYERYNEGGIKSEDIYGQESSNTEEKKSQNLNNELDKPNLNILVQKNINQNSNRNSQAPKIVHYLQIIVMPNF